MKSGAISFIMVPIKNKLVTTDIIIGMVLGKAKSSQFHDLQYSYSIIENKFNYIYKNYEFIEKNHFGYQMGLNITFSIAKSFGLQINSRIQDLSNGGTFFFVGGGLCFKL
jgi:hypothetical protein